jgi:hypothetical protein
MYIDLVIETGICSRPNDTTDLFQFDNEQRLICLVTDLLTQKVTQDPGLQGGEYLKGEGEMACTRAVSSTQNRSVWIGPPFYVGWTETSASMN